MMTPPVSTFSAASWLTTPLPNIPPPRSFAPPSPPVSLPPAPAPRPALAAPPVFPPFYPPVASPMASPGLSPVWSSPMTGYSPPHPPVSALQPIVIPVYAPAPSVPSPTTSSPLLPPTATPPPAIFPFERKPEPPLPEARALPPHAKPPSSMASLGRFLSGGTKKVESYDWIGNFVPGTVLGAVGAGVLNYLWQNTQEEGRRALLDGLGAIIPPLKGQLAKIREESAGNRTVFEVQPADGRLLRYTVDDAGRPRRVFRATGSSPEAPLKRYADFIYDDKKNTSQYTVSLYDDTGLNRIQSVKMVDDPEIRYYGDNRRIEYYRPVNNATQKGFILTKTQHLSPTDALISTETYETALNAQRELYYVKKTVQQHQGGVSWLGGLFAPSSVEYKNLGAPTVRKTLCEIAPTLPRGAVQRQVQSAELQIAKVAKKYGNYRGMILAGLIGGISTVLLGLWEQSHKHTMVNLTLNSGGSITAE